MSQQKQKAQENAKIFLNQHNVEKIISEMINSLVHSKDPNPIIFMIKYLSNLTTEQELGEHGISVQGPLPQKVPIVAYPQFDLEFQSLLKKHMSREVWSVLKRKTTSMGGNIQLCVKSGIQQLDPIGVMACDEEAYKQFSDLMGPIIQDLHRKFDFRYAYKFEEIDVPFIAGKIEHMEEEIAQMENIMFRAKRNFRGMPFTPLMTRESKLQVEKKITEVLGELYGQYFPIKQVTPEDHEWLQERGVSLQENKVHTAAGINDDHPAGKGIFKEENNKFVILVNMEDHLEIVMLPGAGDEILTSLDSLKRLLRAFDKIGFANDAYLGYLTTSPENLGTGIKMSCTFKPLISKGEEECESISSKYTVKAQALEDINALESLVTLAANTGETKAICDFFVVVKEMCS